MQVRDVLSAKRGRVITIDQDATVGEAIARLVENNIGSLPVTDAHGRLIGIFSERDILRGLHGRGEDFARVRVSDVMTLDPVTCHLEDDVDDIMGKMSERRIAKLPVLDGPAIVGIVSVGDVIRVMYERVHSENQHLLTYIHGSF
jgi:CBS domain-containing protein